MRQPNWRKLEWTIGKIEEMAVRHPAFVKKGAPERHKREYDEQWEKLEEYERILRHCLIQVNSNQYWLALQRDGLYRVPREDRYSARQSIKDRESNYQRVHDRAARLLELIVKMKDDLGGGNFLELLSKAAKRGNELAETVLKQNKDQIDSFEDAQAISGTVPLAMIIALLIIVMGRGKDR